MDFNYSDKYRKLGQNIAYYRKDRNFTQYMLAEALGIERNHMSGIEVGKNAPSMDLIFKICEKLEITEKELFDFR